MGDKMLSHEITRKFIKIAMLEKGIETFEELEKQSRISRGIIKRICRGDGSAKFAHVEKLLNFLDIKLTKNK